MEKIEKGLQILMIAVIILMIAIFFFSITVGHATDYRFLFSFQDIPKLNIATLINSNLVL